MSYDFHISKKQLILGGVTLLIFISMAFLLGFFWGHLKGKRLQLATSVNMKAEKNTKKDEIIKQNSKDQDDTILNRDLTFEDILKIKRDIEKNKRYRMERREMVQVRRLASNKMKTISIEKKIFTKKYRR